MLQVTLKHAAGMAEIQPLVWNQISTLGKCQEKYFIFFSMSYTLN